MKKILLSLAAVTLTATAFAAEVGDTTIVIDQTFNENTVLVNPSNNKYMWGDEIQSMITENGVKVSNWIEGATDKNYQNFTNRDFLTFKSAQGSATKELCVSYEVYSPRDKGQAKTEYEINYFNSKKQFVFGIQETSGEWAYGANIITANEDGTTTTTALPAGHMSKGGGELVNLSVKFSGDNAIIEIDGNSYSAYTATKGIQYIKLSVGGRYGYDRDMFIKSYKLSTVEVEAVETAKYTLKYVVGDEVIKEVEKSGVVGSEIKVAPSDEDVLWNEDKTVKYIFVSDDVEGKTVDAEGNTVVTLTYREAETWNYSVSNNVNDELIEGTCIEGESVSVAYHRYILATDGQVWLKAPCGGDKKLEYNYVFTPDADNYVATLEYVEDVTNGVLFAEAEDIVGMTATSANNANVRCSNDAGAYVEVTEENPDGKIQICKLSAGTYQVSIAVWGGEGNNLTIKAGEEEVITVATTGSWTAGTSKEFTLDAETAITFEGSTSSRILDYILITGTGVVTEDSTAVKAVEAVNGDNNWYNLQGVRVAEPTQSGLYIHNGKKVIVK